MKFVHPHFGIEIDTKSEKVQNMVKRLGELYAELPGTKCLQCPGQCSVTAECCKVFSPPMNLVEFVHIMTDIGELDQEQRTNLALKCLDSFVNPDYFKACTLLEGINCSVYNQRPLACRLFGVYVEAEYRERVKNVSAKLPSYVDIPFREQCTNLEYTDGKREIFRGHSDRIFKQIHELDMEFFDTLSESDAKDLVMSSCTYMPFEAHYLCVVLGPDALDLLAEMKMSLRKTKDAYMLDKSNIPNHLAYSKKEKQVKDFLDEIKKNIVPEETEKSENSENSNDSNVGDLLDA